MPHAPPTQGVMERGLVGGQEDFTQTRKPRQPQAIRSAKSRIQTSRFGFLYRPMFSRFVPGFILGFIASTWVNAENMKQVEARAKAAEKKAKTKKKKPPTPKGVVIEELPDDYTEEADSSAAAFNVKPGMDLKMVLVIRGDLDMTAGKIAAQCCHATLGVYQSLEQKHAGMLRSWEAGGQKKVALKCKSDGELEQLAAIAKAQRLPHYLVADAGRTQVAAGSRTVLAIGPAPSEAIDAVTGKLRLY